MIYLMSKVIGRCVTPFGIGLFLLCIGTLLIFLRRIRLGGLILVLDILWIWIMSTPVVGDMMAMHLEVLYPNVPIEKVGHGDVIHILGGGMALGGPDAESEVWCPNICSAADRVWHGARLWKAGCAPEVVITGPDSKNSTLPFLSDLGVPTYIVHAYEEPRTTEEEVRCVNARYEGKRVILVTSAIHMRRAMSLFEKYGPTLTVIPAACDYVALPWCEDPITFDSFLPTAERMSANSALLHEYMGYWGRRFLEVIIQ